DVIAILQEFGAVGALQIDDPGILRFNNYLLIGQGTQPSRHSLQLLGFSLLRCRFLMLPASGHRNTRSAWITAAGISARKIAAARIWATWIRSDLRHCFHGEERKSQPQGRSATTHHYDPIIHASSCA